MISPHLPALQVVVPLIAAPLCILLRGALAAWSVALAAAWTSLAISLALLVAVLDGGPIVYLLGGWAAPWGIEYRVDVLNAFVLVIVGAIAAITLPYARPSAAYEISEDRQYLFHAGLLLFLTGLLGIAITGDLFNLFVFLEISSLSSYLLISLGHERRALTAAYRYLVAGTVGATFYVIGVGLLYMMTGTLNMADMAERLPAVAGTHTVLAGFAFLSVGLGLKAAVFPLHQWLPGAYAFAPSVVSAFMAGTATKVSIYVFARLFLGLFAGTGLFEAFPLAAVLAILAALGMLAGSLAAAFQDHAKRLLAHSSVAQIGYMMLGISMLSVEGVAGGIVHLFNHALMKTALFMALGCVVLRVGSARTADLAGLGRAMPWTMAAFVAGGLSLIGIPGTVGFVSKWALLGAALDAGAWHLALLILATSLIAVAYVWRLVETAYFRPRPADAPAVAEAPAAMLIPLWTLVGAMVWFGLDGARTLDIATRAARLLIEGGP